MLPSKNLLNPFAFWGDIVEWIFVPTKKDKCFTLLTVLLQFSIKCDVTRICKWWEFKWVFFFCPILNLQLKRTSLEGWHTVNILDSSTRYYALSLLANQRRAKYWTLNFISRVCARGFFKSSNTWAISKRISTAAFVEPDIYLILPNLAKACAKFHSSNLETLVKIIFQKLIHSKCNNDEEGNW